MQQVVVIELFFPIREIFHCLLYTIAAQMCRLFLMLCFRHYSLLDDRYQYFINVLMCSKFKRSIVSGVRWAPVFEYVCVCRLFRCLLHNADLTDLYIRLYVIVTYLLHCRSQLPKSIDFLLHSTRNETQKRSTKQMSSEMDFSFSVFRKNNFLQFYETIHFVIVFTGGRRRANSII